MYISEPGPGRRPESRVPTTISIISDDTDHPAGPAVAAALLAAAPGPAVTPGPGQRRANHDLTN